MAFNSNIPPGTTAAELHRYLDAPDEIRCEDCDIGDPDELTEVEGPTGGVFYLCENHAKKRRLKELRKKEAA
jgi:hypothetical protein